MGGVTRVLLFRMLSAHSQTPKDSSQSPMLHAFGLPGLAACGRALRDFPPKFQSVWIYGDFMCYEHWCCFSMKCVDNNTFGVARVHLHGFSLVCFSRMWFWNSCCPSNSVCQGSALQGLEPWQTEFGAGIQTCFVRAQACPKNCFQSLSPDKASLALGTKLGLSGLKLVSKCPLNSKRANPLAVVSATQFDLTTCW